MRIVLVESAYWQNDGEQPQYLNPDLRIAIPVNGKAPYTRPTLVLGPEWVSLDLGWIDNPWMLIVENRTRAPRQTRPTQAENQTLMSRKVILGIQTVDKVHPVSSLDPGLRIRLFPENWDKVRVRGVGEPEAYFTIVPKRE